MSKSNDSWDLVAVLALLGLSIAGVAALASMSKSEQRQRFQSAIRDALADRGVGLVSAELGGRRGGGFVWHVTVNHPWVGIQLYRAAFGADQAPYAATTLRDLLNRLFDAMPPTEHPMERLG